MVTHKGPSKYWSISIWEHDYGSCWCNAQASEYSCPHSSPLGDIALAGSQIMLCLLSTALLYIPFALCLHFHLFTVLTWRPSNLKMQSLCLILLTTNLSWFLLWFLSTFGHIYVVKLWENLGTLETDAWTLLPMFKRLCGKNLPPWSFVSYTWLHLQLLKRVGCQWR